MSTTIIAIIAFLAGLAAATAISMIAIDDLTTIPTKLIPTDEAFNKIIIKAPKSLPDDFITKRKEGLKKLHIFYTEDGQTFYEKSELKEFIAWYLEEETN